MTRRFAMLVLATALAPTLTLVGSRWRRPGYPPRPTYGKGEQRAQD